MSQPSERQGKPPKRTASAGAGASSEPAGSRLRASPDDRALVERLLAGDESAFVSLVGRYHQRLVYLAMHFVGDRATAEEVVQETWLGMLNGLRSFEGRSSLTVWIFSILTNRAKSRAIREKRSIPFSSLTDPGAEHEPAVDPGRFTSSGMWAMPPAPWTEETPERVLLRQEAMAVLEKELSKLPPSQRAVLTLRDVEGLESREVCSVLEISETHQRVLLHRARSRIRRALEQYMVRK